MRLHYQGGNIFRLGATWIIVRATNAKELGRLVQARGRGRVVYIVDDHFESGMADDNLPNAYRDKLRTHLVDQHEAIVELASDVVVPNQPLADAYDRLTGGKPVHVIDPVYPDSSLGHHEGRATVRIGLLSTRSHQADLRSLGPVLSAVLDAHRASMPYASAIDT